MDIEVQKFARKQANLQVQQHHGDQKRSQRFLKEWSEFQESAVLDVECVHTRERGEKGRRERGRRGRERRKQEERLKGNINNQFHTFTHAHVIRIDYTVV